VARYRVVPSIPDLIPPETYADDPDGRLVRVRIEVTEDGVRILGDAVRPDTLERLLEALGCTDIDQMLCG
jgi:hypothetical protein